jgi:urate oxidase
MVLLHNRYGKDRVRVMRIQRDGDRHEVRELTIKAMLEGDFGRSFTAADNSKVIATDTIKNIVNICARRHLALATEPFCQVVAGYFLEHYAQVEKATIVGHETKWSRLTLNGTPHPHSFVLDSNGKPFSRVSANRASVVTESGIEGFTFMKSTGSGWSNYVMDATTTLEETRDRMAATAMNASWVWSAAPEDYPGANAKVLDTLLEVFSTTYSEGIQDSLYRMGEAALARVPAIKQISMTCPNKHYLLIDLKHFGLENNNQVFLPTDEPHGQIECTVGRSA